MKIIFFLILACSNFLLAWQVGDRVLAKWHDNLWYPGSINSVIENKFEIAYDDGDIIVIGQEKIKKIDWQEGTKIQGNWKNKGKYYSGKILKINREILHVLYDDGDQEIAAIGRFRSK